MKTIDIFKTPLFTCNLDSTRHMVPKLEQYAYQQEKYESGRNVSNVGGHQRIWVSSDSGSSYDSLTDPHIGDGQGWYVGASTEAFVNVTNASTFRVKFEKTGAWNMYGDTNKNRTCMTFVRLGDSQ